MNDGHHIVPGLIYAPVDRPLGIHGAALLVHGVSLQGVFHEVVPFHQVRGSGLGKDVPIGPFRVTDTDVAIGVNHALPRQDSVGRDQQFQLFVDVVHKSVLPLSRRRAE